MKRYLIIITALLFGVSCIQAQTDNKTREDRIAKGVSKLIHKAKSAVEQVGDEISEAISIEERSHEEVDKGIKIEGRYYMPLYDTHLYHGSEEQEILKISRLQFVKNYPKAEILSVVIPQKEEVTKTITKGRRGIAGYAKTIYCFVLAKDGCEGYIHCRYIFPKFKKVGFDYKRQDKQWGTCDRAEVLSHYIYNTLKNHETTTNKR